MKDKAPLVKTQILTTAEKMFHDYGYNNTTFQQIADEIGITKSTISYHFKNKYLLLLYMIDEYFQYLRDFIDQYPDEYQNAYWRICVMYIYFYRVITSSEKNLDLFYRKDAMDVWETSKVGIVSNHYRAIIRDFHKPFDELDLRVPVGVFIGGSKGRMGDIIRTVCQKNPSVRLLVSAIALETLQQTLDACKQEGLTQIQVTQIAVSRTRPAGQLHLLMAQNPVFLIQASR